MSDDAQLPPPAPFPGREVVLSALDGAVIRAHLPPGDTWPPIVVSGFHPTLRAFVHDDGGAYTEVGPVGVLMPLLAW